MNEERMMSNEDPIIMYPAPPAQDTGSEPSTEDELQSVATQEDEDR
jgi:hypothetical protein